MDAPPYQEPVERVLSGLGVDARAGLSTREVMFAMVLASLSVGAAGILAHHAGVPDGVLFMGLLGLYTVQHLLTRRAWRLQRWIGDRRRSYIAPN